jgi:LPS sulfotransferase NodH
MDNELINKIQEALEQYDQSWDEWLSSNACFLTELEVKAIGYLLAFQCVEETARLLKKSQDEYLLILDHTIEKLKDQHSQYKAWLAQKIIMSN